VFCLWPRNKATEFWMGWWDIPSTEETEIPKVPHQEHVDKLFRPSRRSAQRIRTRGNNSKCRILEGSNGLPPWSAFSGFVQLRSSLEIFSCCTIIRPPTKLQVFANFWLQKILCVPMELILNLKKGMSSSLVFDLKKNNEP